MKDEKDLIIAELQAIVESLTAEVVSLLLALAKAKKNSSTSSKSPSSDIVKPPQKTGRSKKSNPGGQRGHQRKLQEHLPPKCVNASFVNEMKADDVRECELNANNQFENIQRIELLDLTGVCRRASVAKIPGPRWPPAENKTAASNSSLK